MTYREDNYIDAGELRFALEILTAAEPVDDLRGTPELIVHTSCWGAWEPLRGDRAQLMQQQYGRVNSRVVIRYQPGILPGMFVRRTDDGVQAAIEAVVPVSAGQRYLELMVNEGG